MNLPTKRTNLLSVIILLSVFIFSCSKSSTDDSTPGKNEVFMRNTAFTPSSITVTKGSSVKWTNKDDMTHTVTSDNGLFDSGDKNLNETFTHLFDSLGTFSYHCNTHSGMTGTVIVTRVTVNVSIQSSAFYPASQVISKGTIVKWTNNDGMDHTVTSNSAVFDSGNISSTQTYSYTFNTPGSYPYHCTIHGVSMSGTITVN